MNETTRFATGQQARSNASECENVLAPLDVREPWLAYAYMYGFSALILFGLPANAVSFLVLKLDRPCSTTRTFLLFLTVADALILTFNFILYPLKTFCDVYNTKWLEWVEYGDSHVLLFTNIAKLAQVWLTVVISADRYFAVCHPTNAARVRSVSNAKRVSLLIIVSAVVANIPRFYSFYRIPVQCYNRTVYRSVQTNLFPAYELVYDSIVDPLIFFFVPMLALLIFNSLLIYSVRKANASRKQMKVRARNEVGTTLTLIAVVSTFMVCESPTLFMQLMDFCYQITEYYGNTTSLAAMFCFRLLEDERTVFVTVLAVLLNSCTNFFVYVLTAEKFRIILRHLSQRVVRRSFSQ